MMLCVIRPSAVALIAVMALLIQASSADYPIVEWTTPVFSSQIGNRTFPGCAVRNTVDAKNMTSTLIVMYGGLVNGFGTGYNDVFLVDPAVSTAPFTQTVQNGDGPGNGLYVPMMDILYSGLILLYGGSYTSVVYSSTDAQLWEIATKNAAWSPRVPGLVGGGHVVIPFTNTVVMTPGYSQIGFDNASWVCNDGVGAKWTVSGYIRTADAAVESAVVAVNPKRDPMSNGTVLILGGVQTSGLILNTIFLTSDLGATWSTILPIWSPRYGQNAVADIHSGIYMLNGLTSFGTPDSAVWYSPDIGKSWLALINYGTPIQIQYGCMVWYNDPPVLLQIGGLYNNSLYNGYMTTIIYFDSQVKSHGNISTHDIEIPTVQKA